MNASIADRVVARRFADWFALQHDARIEDYRVPEREKGQIPIDAAFCVAGVGYCLEHTFVETYEEQRLDDFAFERVFVDLQRGWRHPLPWRVDLSPLSLTGAQRKMLLQRREIVQSSLTEWILKTVGSLQPRERVEAQPRGVPVRIALWRSEHGVKTLFVSRFSIGAGREQRRELRLRRALNEKLPKLARAKDEHRGLSILLVEAADAAQGGEHLIAPAVVTLLRRRPPESRPDCVYLVETQFERFAITPIKHGPMMYPESPFQGWEHERMRSLHWPPSEA